MPEGTRKRILLTAVIALLGATLIDRSAVKPLRGYISYAEKRIPEIRAEIAAVEAAVKEAATSQPGQPVFDEGRIPPANEENQNRYSRYLESETGLDLVVLKKSTGRVTDVPDMPGLKMIIHELDLEGEAESSQNPIESMRKFLNSLDRSAELLRLEGLKISLPSPETRVPGMAMKMNMTVSTIAREAAEDSADEAPFVPLPPTPAGKPLPPLAKNIFLPSEEPTVAQPYPTVQDEFVLRAAVVVGE